MPKFIGDALTSFRKLLMLYDLNVHYILQLYTCMHAVSDSDPACMYSI